MGEERLAFLVIGTEVGIGIGIGIGIVERGGGGVGSGYRVEGLVMIRVVARIVSRIVWYSMI